MKLIPLLLMLLLFLATTVAGQSPCRSYDCALSRARDSLNAKQYTGAFNHLESAEGYPNADLVVVRELRRELFEAVDEEKKEAVRQREAAQKAEWEARTARREAEQERARAEAALEKINNFYFYKDRFALAYKNGSYYYIDKNGEEVTKLGRWERAEQFDDLGFAKVGENYLIDTTGQTYLVSYEVNETFRGMTARDLRGRRLDSIPGRAFWYSPLRIVLLGGNRLRELPESIWLTNLTSLDLSDNELQTLPESMDQLKSLTTLNLSRNRLRELPESIWGLTNLTSLDLSGNELDTLPESMGQLKSLTALNLSRNRLRELPEPESIWGLTNLTSLDLGNAPLSPAYIEQLREKMPWCEINWKPPTAREYFSAKKYPEAFAAQQQAIAADPTDAALYFSLSWYALFAGQPEIAIEAAQKTLSLDPNAVRVETNLALGYLLSGQWTKAEEVHRKWKGKKFPYDGTLTLRDAIQVFLKDIQDLKKAGIDHPDLAKAEAWLKAPE